jgi:hypothetical protein
MAEVFATGARHRCLLVCLLLALVMLLGTAQAAVAPDQVKRGFLEVDRHRHRRQRGHHAQRARGCRRGPPEPRRGVVSDGSSDDLGSDVGVG